MGNLIKDDLVNEHKIYRENIARYLSEMKMLLNFWITVDGRVLLMDNIFRTFAKLQGIQLCRTNEGNYTRWNFKRPAEWGCENGVGYFEVVATNSDLFKSANEWVKGITSTLETVERYLELPHWQEPFPEEFRTLGEIDELHEWRKDSPWLKREFGTKLIKDDAIAIGNITQPKKPEPEPKKVYLTTHNPYMSKDWKKRFEEIMEARMKTDPWSVTVDTDVASMYPKLEPLVKEELAVHSPSKALYEVGKLAAKCFNEGVRKMHEDAAFDAMRYSWNKLIEDYCQADVKVCMDIYNGRKEKEESMYDWMAHSYKEIMADMGTILHRRQIAEKDFKSKEWVWEISEDIWCRLTEKPEFIGHCYSTSLQATIYCIDVRVTKFAQNYIKLIRKVKEEEKSMNNLYNSKEVIIRAEDGTEYKARINVIEKRCDEPVSMDLYLVDEHPIGKAYNAKPFVTMPRHSGYSEAMEWSQFASGMLYGIDLNHSIPKIDQVIFNAPATIVYWKDGTKTVVQARGEMFDPEKGLAMAISKKAMGNTRDYYIPFKKWLKKFEKNKK